MPKTAPRRGRPPLSWLGPTALKQLPAGTALVVDPGSHRPTLRGRLEGVAGNELVLSGDRTVLLRRGVKGRVVSAVYEPGDLVLRRGVSEHEWRGGVVRCRGVDVLVESIDGFEWVREMDLETPDERDRRDRPLDPRA